jgi:hypothetical protein
MVWGQTLTSGGRDARISAFGHGWDRAAVLRSRDAYSPLSVVACLEE